jgi:pimeloyl-ACP methyl ester carboxylesterase
MQPVFPTRPACSALWSQPGLQRRIPRQQARPLREFSREIGGYRIRAVHMAEAEAAGSAPAVFLLHGMVDSSATWRRLLPALAGFSVWAFDMPWSGLDGPGWPSVMTAEQWWRAALALCPEAPDICIGHSFGAAVLLDWLAGDPLTAPDIRCLVLLSPFYDPAMRTWRWDDIDHLARDVPVRLREALLSRFGTTPPDAAILAHMTAKLVERIVPDGVLELVRFGLRSRRWQLDAVAIPALVIVGERETDARRPYGAGLEAALPQGERLVVEDCGHFCMHERPEQIVRRLQHWLPVALARAGQADEVVAA